MIYFRRIIFEKLWHELVQLNEWLPRELACLFFQRYGFWIKISWFLCRFSVRPQMSFFKTTCATWQFGLKVHISNIWSAKGSQMILLHGLRQLSNVSWSTEFPPSVCLSPSYSWGCLLVTVEDFMQTWSTLPQMSPRGHCDHSCHIKVLCILKESVRGAEVLYTRLRKQRKQKGSHQTEDLRKFKGNVEKSYTEISHLWILLMEPQINIFITDPKLSVKGENSSAEMQLHPGRGFAQILAGLPLVFALLLLSE